MQTQETANKRDGERAIAVDRRRIGDRGLRNYLRRGRFCMSRRLALSPSRRIVLGSSLRLVLHRDCLFTFPSSQIIEFGSADAAVALDFNFGDSR